LLKKQSSIAVYRLPTKKNKLLFSVSVCSKQIEVYCFRFPFAANKRKLPFSLSFVFRIGIYMLPFKLTVYIYAAVSNGKRKPNRFSLVRLSLLIVQTELSNLSVCCRRTKRKLSICKRICPSIHNTKHIWKICTILP
jgi:hypothetical protein